MKRTLVISFFLSLCIFGFTQTYTGSIIRVIDGDTFVFQTQEGSLKIRMNGIDAPEHNQPYGKESTEFMSKYLYKDAMIKTNGVDRYGRTIATLFINNQDINLLSIKSGNSWHYKKYSSDVDYANAEIDARNKKIGLWSLPDPIPPWEWRKMK